MFESSSLVLQFYIVMHRLLAMFYDTLLCLRDIMAGSDVIPCVMLSRQLVSNHGSR